MPPRPKKREGFAKDVVSRVQVPFTGRLIEAFVMKYLHDKYDNPQPTPQFHRDNWAVAADATIDKALFLDPRGHGKSTSITEGYGMPALLFRQRDFATIFSNTLSQSVEFLYDFKLEVTENEDIVKDFGIRRLLRDREDDLIVQFTDGHKFRIVAGGSEGEIRGIKWNKRRPNLILCDDLEGKEQLSSVEHREAFKKWFMNDVLPLGSDDVLIRMVATIRHFDSLAQNLSKDPTWVTLRHRAHKGFSDFSEILWPEKFSEEKLRRIQSSYIKLGNRDGYSQEYLNHPIAEGASFFRPEDLMAMEEPHYHYSFRKYAAWDFAISLKEGADFTVGVVIGLDDLGGIYVLDVRRGRWDSKEIIEEMFSVQAAWSCDVHWAEAGQIEKALGPFLYSEMRARDKFFNVEPVIPVKDKVSRAASWRAKTRAKAVRYDKKASWWPALEEEMVRFPKGEHDDQIDPQSLLGLQLEGLQPQLSPKEQEEVEYLSTFGRGFHKQGVSKQTGY